MKTCTRIFAVLSLILSIQACESDDVVLIYSQSGDLCKDNAKKCFNNAIQACSNGTWIKQSDCQNGCDRNTNACADKKVECTLGDLLCDQAVASRCTENGWIDEICPDGCDDDMLHCASVQPVTEKCTPGCFDNRMTLCDDDGNPSYTKCTFGCSGDFSSCKTREDEPEICTPGCVNSLRITCTSEGLKKTTKCPNGCDSNGLECFASSSDLCITGCSGGVMTVCHAGGEYSVTKCEFGCNDELSDCAVEPVCRPGCAENIKTVCQNGNSVTSECPFGCLSDGSDCAECRINDGVCEHNTLKTCVDGHWQTTTCDNGCASDGLSCALPPSCAENQLSCVGNELFKCSGGSLVAQKTCDFGCNQAGTDCAECRNGNSTCKSGTLSTCTNEKWSSTVCKYGCNAASNACEEVNENQPTRYLMKTLHSPITPYVVTQMKTIAAKNTSRNNDVFIKIGDSHYDYDFDGCFMKCFSNNTSQAVSLDGRNELQNVIATFQKTKDSFNRDSLAAVGGSSTRNGLSGSPNLITQEISALNPRFAFFGHGSNDIGNGSFVYNLSGYEGYPWSIQDYYRQVNKALDLLIENGIIPLISGITPNYTTPTGINYLANPPAIDKRDYPRYIVQSFNAISRGIAEARQLPWFNTYQAYINLSNHGLRTSDNIHGSTSGSPCNFTADGLKYGVNQRNLGSIQMLNAAWQTVVNNAAPSDTIDEPFKGNGSPSSPFLVTSLPFTHSANTAKSSNKIINFYDGCSSPSSGEYEYGPEYYYEMVLNKKTRLRMFAVSATGVDVDIQVMKNKPDAASCVVRSDIMLHGYLDAGTYYISVDTFGQNSTSPGTYLLGIVECETDDVRCDSPLAKAK